MPKLYRSHCTCRSKSIHKEQSELLKKGSEHLFCSLKRCGAFSCLVPSLSVVMGLDGSVGYCHCTLGFHQPALPTISSSLPILISSGNLIGYSNMMACIIMDLEQKFFLQIFHMVLQSQILLFQLAKSINHGLLTLTSPATTDIVWV